MAKEIKGVMQNKTGFCIKNQSGFDIYPSGRQLRGALGYIALNLEFNIADKFTDLNWDGVIFRDMLPICKCGKIYNMDINGNFLLCSTCKTTYDSSVLKEARTVDFEQKEIPEGNMYRLSLVVLNEQYLREIEALLDYVYINGLGLGNKISKGYGKFVNREYFVQNASPVKGNSFKLLSDAITEKGTKTISFSKTVLSNNSYEIITEKAIGKGAKVNQSGHNGFYFGRYGGLGFGEIAENR